MIVLSSIVIILVTFLFQFIRRNKFKKNSADFTSFQDLKFNFITNFWLISVYDKRLNFNCNVNSLTNWYSCITNKVLKNIFFSQLSTIKGICNNSDSLILAQHNLAVAANDNNFPPNLLTEIFNCKL